MDFKFNFKGLLVFEETTVCWKGLLTHFGNSNLSQTVAGWLFNHVFLPSKTKYIALCTFMCLYGKRNILYLFTVTFQLLSPVTIRDIFILCTTNIASGYNINFWLYMPVKLAIHHHTVLRLYSSLRKTASMGLRYPIVSTSVAGDI